jgi:methyl coenzyme M reductase subunit C-like uncharacterized protein (methanogenesis marker protein 7)
MEDFENAQKLFDAYQKNGRFHNLRDSLDILEKIIESQEADVQRAINFKQIIERHIDTQLNEIWVKSNVDEFGRTLKDDQLTDLLLEAMSEEDRSKFFNLFSIKKDYFK